MKRNIYIIMLIIIAMFIAGCTFPVIPIDEPAVDDQNHSESPSEEEANESNQGDDVHGVKDDRLVAANQKFSWDLFKKLNEEDAKENIFISPFSISSALTMAMNGAEGKTRTEMEKALHYDGMTREDINLAYAWETNRLTNLDKKVTLRNANSIWTRNNFEIKKDFVEMNQKYLSAEAQALDFDKPSATETINSWVDEKTNGLIPEIVTPPIPQDTIMYLINAIYFKGEWTTEFEEKETKEQNFHSLDGSTGRVPMMRRNGKIDYFQNEELKAVRLPYGDEKISMVLILPHEDINQWIHGMDHDKWKEIQENLRPVSDVELQIPKFKMEYGKKELKEVLSGLGIMEAFSQTADFSGIADNILISSILHKAVVDVNEKGTEAAAVTSIEVKVTSVREPVSFIADRPFFFAIVDNEAGSILFMGKKVTNQ
ncbi:MAG: serpin family protein [Clostridiaceae bacterium]|nr:serpin family protein [Clostridiaceae bacterium]